MDTGASYPTAGSTYLHWPTSEEYLTCLWNQPLLQNSEVRRASQNVFRSCVERQLWPFFEVPQTIDSPVLLGSFNWGLLLLTGMVVLSSFAVYTASPIETGYVRKGESSSMMRLGLAWSGIALVWNFIYLVILLFVAFRNGGSFTTLPTTASTTHVTLLTLAVAVIYFLGIVLKPISRQFIAMYRAEDAPTATIVEVPDGVPVKSVDQESQLAMLKSTFPEVAPSGEAGESGRYYALTEDDVIRYYTPPMLAAWADSYLADPLIVLGMAGATGQLTTDQAYFLFTFSIGYRLLNMIISRCISDTFMNNIRLTDEENKAKNSIVSRPSMFSSHGREKAMDVKDKRGWGERSRGKSKHHNVDVHLNTNVIGFSTQLAAVWLFIGILFIVFNGNSPLMDFKTFYLFIVFGFFIPEILRLGFHLFYQATYDGTKIGKGVPWMLYNGFFAIWVWDLVVRILFVSLVLIDATNSPGTYDYLKTQTNSLMRDYVASMVV
jgi:hypothetical protein